MSDQLAIGREIQRKLIHLLTSAIPLAYISIIPIKEHIFFICVILAIGFLSVDLLRMFSLDVRRYFLTIFASLLREDEINRRLTGATYLFIGLTLAVILFPKEIAIPVMLFLTLADPCAAIIGKKYPIKKIFDKSLGGFLAFAGCAVIIVFVFMGYGLLHVLIALCAAIVEILPVKIDDNLSIPVISGYLFILIK